MERQPVSARSRAVDATTDWSRAFRNEILSELIRMGALMDIDCTEIHIGSYGYFEL